MANAYISSFTELALLNTSSRPGVILLPSITTIPGRILTFKDLAGAFLNSTITFSTSVATQRFEDGTIRQTYNDTFGSYSFIAGTDSNWYTIGGSRMNTAFISSIASIQLNVLNISTVNNVTTSTLQIIDSSLRSTTTSFYQSSILYYSSPTGTFIWGGTRAPRSLITRMGGVFNPRQISGLSLWLDGSDLNTLAFSEGNRINTWRDKSGSNFNFTVSGIGAPYTNTRLGGLNFTANKYISTYPANPTNETCFVVFRPNVSATSFIIGSTANGGRELGFNVNVNAFGIVNAGVGWGAQTATLGVGTDNIGVTVLSGGNSTQVAVNGNALGSAVVFTAVSAGLTQLGYEINVFPYNGFTYEILSYLRVLTQIEIQQVEGYLAWKWGLVANLPSNHPYKNSPP